MGRKKSLSLSRGFEALHDPLASSGRLVRILCPIVETFVLAMLDAGHDRAPGPTRSFSRLIQTHAIQGRASVRRDKSAAQCRTDADDGLGKSLGRPRPCRQRAETLPPPKIIERLQDIVGDEGHRPACSSEFVIARHAKRQIELEARALR